MCTFVLVCEQQQRHNSRTITRCSYTSVEVLQMEEKLLNSLNFGLAVPTSLDFLNIIEALMPPLEHKTVMLAQVRVCVCVYWRRND